MSEFEILMERRRSQGTIINFIISYAFLVISMGWLMIEQYFLCGLWLFFSIAVIILELAKGYSELRESSKELERARGKLEAVQEMKQIMEKRMKHRGRRTKK